MEALGVLLNVCDGEDETLKTDMKKIWQFDPADGYNPWATLLSGVSK